MKELFERLKHQDVGEIILATNPTVEGEATAMYLLGLLEGTQIKISRIGMGVPIGGSLDYCDEITMAKAIENRRLLS
jgi:recombination protein RecR